uniref:RIB43A-like with coiled-coils protein 1 n=1 Tax=Neogobius melanostomus TaxID=47308 RepID=A0A8C6SZQ3_9GOBI
MHKVDLPVDQSTQNAVERRRAAESARKERIFNTRLRVIGLDLQALEQQVQDRKHQHHLEKQRDRVYDSLRLNNDDALVQQDTSEKQRRTDLHSDLSKFWSTYQRVEDSRDADLKIGLKGALTLSIPESELGPASMQIFEVGFVSLTDACQPSKDQQNFKLWTELHLIPEDLLHGQELMYEDYRGVEMRALEEEWRRASRMALDNYNHALQAERKREEQRREERENVAEMWHTVTSDMMTECAEAAERCLGGGRPPQVLTDRWKGMSPAQLNVIRKQREAQCVEKQVREEVQSAEELRRQRRAEMDQYNRLLAKEQQTHQDYLDNIVYTNKPTKDYFRQFNTSTR